MTTAEVRCKTCNRPARECRNSYIRNMQEFLRKLIKPIGDTKNTPVSLPVTEEPERQVSVQESSTMNALDLVYEQVKLSGAHTAEHLRERYVRESCEIKLPKE
jgi:hypothetical protein